MPNDKKQIDKTNTPMMAQFMAIKKEHPDSILFYRMGDFYEMFGEDAVTASKILGVTLTSRNKQAENQIPMCGVPHHAYKQYAVKLIKAGYKVAVCDQLEDPSLAKGLVKRGVTRIITPGTVIDEEELASPDNNFLAAIFQDKTDGGFFIAAADVSTGEIYLTVATEKNLEEKLSTFRAQEVLSSTPLAFSFTERPAPVMDVALKLVRQAYRRSEEELGIYDTRLSVPLGMIIGYLNEMLLQVSLELPVVLSDEDRLIIDRTAADTLELVESFDSYGMSLFDVLNYTVTAMGRRMLRWWILHPLRRPDEIRKRLDIVSHFAEDWRTAQTLRALLKEISDIERIVSRALSGRIKPRELISLKNSLEVLPRIADILEGSGVPEIAALAGSFHECGFVEALIAEGIADNPADNLTGGGIIRAGYNRKVDELRDIKNNGRSLLAALESRYKTETGIGQLKVSYNKVFGYYIEVSKTNLPKVPQSFERKQTLVGAERFITPELKELENTILGAEDNLAPLEYELFSNIRGEVAESTQLIRKISKELALLDSFLSLSNAAVTRRYIRPEITENALIQVSEARHPVVELTSEEPFVSNDILLDNTNNRLLIITGPNMSGKSTYIRSVALVAVMAHIGSFVPAKSALVGVADRIFTRVGASDNIARGQSTFMVEMVETANILNNATEHSIVILDEIGRGTSTYDGLSIAWAVTEHLLENIKARTLFATHYHELTAVGLRQGAKNYTVSVKENEDEVIFMRRIVEGTADKSYGIYVAQIAGLPPHVVKRANNILSELETEPKEKKKISGPTENLVRQILVFDEEHPALVRLKEIEPNNITPLAALAELAALKKLSEE